MSQPATPADPFRPAVRQQVKGRIAVQGLSKKGKTLAALGLARGIVGEEGRIALLDCDNGSAKLYAGTPALATPKQPEGFDHANLAPPFHPDRFIGVLQTAGAWGIDCVILDSISSEWSGPGGIQEIVDDIKRRSRGTGWDVGGPLHQRFLTAIVQCKAHVIATVRLKSDTKVETDENNKLRVRKIGLKPDQRDQYDYEFTIVGTIQENHDFILEGRGGFAERLLPAHEDTSAIDAIARGYVQLGSQIGAWLNSGERQAAAERTPTPAPAESPAAASEAATGPENAPSGDVEPPAGTAEAAGNGAVPLTEAVLEPAAQDAGAGDFLPDDPPAATNSAPEMSEDQFNGLVEKLNTLSELRPDLDWGDRINTKGTKEWGEAFNSWDHATADQAIALNSVLEQAIRQLRERAAAEAAS